jgi:hypothetical protein
MPLTVSEVTDPSDFDMIAPMDHDAWLTPYNPQLKHFRPTLHTRDERIAYVIARNTKGLQEQKPNEWMIKVTDTDTGEIIGFAMWALNEMNEQENEKTEATWYSEGSEEREFAECFINGLWGFLAERVTRKHMGMINLLQCHEVCLVLSRLALDHGPYSTSPPRCGTYARSLGYQQG